MSCDQTHQPSFISYQEHSLKVSSKSDEPNLKYIENCIFLDQIWPKFGLNDGHARARTGEHVAKLISLPFSLYQEPFLKVSSKSDEPNSRYIEKGIFWDQTWPNLGLNDGHTRARIGEHVTKLISLHSLYTKNLSSKFHQNLMNQIQDILKKVYFGTKNDLIWS